MPRQNGHHFPDDIFRRIFLNENVPISIHISLKHVPEGPVNPISALVLVMAWCRPGAKPISKTMVVSLLKHICVTGPQSINVIAVSEWCIDISAKDIIHPYVKLQNFGMQ